jgi:lysine 2,3-aminomutase
MQAWQKELTRSVTTVDGLAKKIKLTPLEIEQAKKAEANFELLITPTFLKLMQGEDENGPIRKQVVPVSEELKVAGCEIGDPIGDNAHSPVKGLVHRYPDRVLIWPTKNCAIHCRFCFRKHLTGPKQWFLTPLEVGEIIKYLQQHPEIQEVIFSGGDPLLMPDKLLDFWMQKIKFVGHIKRIRFHTKLFSALPSRITPSLLKILKQFDPVYIGIHINHPKEISPEFIKSVKRARKAGVVLVTQTVLLRGINDNAEILKELFLKLVNLGVKPYYLHHGDLVSGTSHLRTTMEDGIKIMKQLRGYISGLAMPQYILDIPGGHGKVPIDLNYIKKTKGKTLVSGVFGGEFDYRG